MITYVKGDLFTSPARVLVNTVNTVGVMGKGIAKDFKRLFPDMFREYQQLCEKEEFDIGSLFLYHTPNKSILNFPTKRHWRSPSRVEFIERGLQTFVESHERLNIDSIAFPQLGCGNGELDWETEVRPIMERHLKRLPIRVYIHLYSKAYSFTPEHRDQAWMKSWLTSEPESLPTSEVWDDLVRVARANPIIGEWRLETPEARILVPWIDGEEEQGENEEVLVFSRGLDRFSVSQEEFSPVWRKLSTLGLASQDDLPAGIQRRDVPFMELLLRLEYLERIDFVSPKKSSDELEPGIILIPRNAPASRQLDLLGV